MIADLTVASDRHDLELAFTPAGFGSRRIIVHAGCTCWCWRAEGTVNPAAPGFDPQTMPDRLTALHAEHLAGVHADTAEAAR